MNDYKDNLSEVLAGRRTAVRISLKDREPVNSIESKFPISMLSVERGNSRYLAIQSRSFLSISLTVSRLFRLSLSNRLVGRRGKQLGFPGDSGR